MADKRFDKPVQAVAVGSAQTRPANENGAGPDVSAVSIRVLNIACFFGTSFATTEQATNGLHEA